MGGDWIERWAETLVDYSVGVQRGDVVAITGGVAAEPLLRAVYRAVLTRGGHPVLLPTFPEAEADFLALGDDAQLDYLSPVDRFGAEQADARIIVLADTNTHALSTVDPDRQQRRGRAETPLRTASMQRAADGKLRWSLTLWPTPAYAQDADMGTDAFAGFIRRACKLDQPDPAAAWRELSAEQARLIAWLTPRREVRLVAPDTDLRLGIGGRTWINSDGKRNFPSGEVFTGPVEDSVEGHVRFTFPVVTDGREVHDIRLRFEAGRVVDASAAKGEEFLVRTLDTDAGSRRLGEFAFGTNFGITQFTKNILLDEKIGGTMHMALGAGYPETGNSNTSAIHWDMICDLRAGGQATLDGEVVLKDGAYTV